MKIPSPQDIKEQHNAAKLAAIIRLRDHVSENLRANGDVAEHVVDVSRYDEPHIVAIAQECEAEGWAVARRVDRDEAKKLVLTHAPERPAIPGAAQPDQDPSQLQK